MIIDSLLQFSRNQANEGDSTNTVDFNQKTPNLGMGDTPMYVVVTGKSGFAAGDTMDVDIQHSHQESADFTSVVKVSAQPIGEGKQIIIPMPLHHKRYVKLVYTKQGTGGHVDAQLVIGVQANEPLPENPNVWSGAHGA